MYVDKDGNGNGRGGWYKQWRQTEHSWVFQQKDPALFKIWSFLLMRAAYEERTELIHGHLVTIQRGQLNISNIELSEIMQIEESKVRRLLKSLKLVNQIDVQNMHRSVLITVLNWDKYQEMPSNLTSKCRPNDVQTAAIRKKKERSKEEYIHSTKYLLCDQSSEDGSEPLVLSSPSANEDEKKTLARESKKRGSEADLKAYCLDVGLEETDGEWLFDHWEGNGWINGKAPIKDWKATVRCWKREGFLPSQKNGHSPNGGENPYAEVDRWGEEALLNARQREK